MVEALESRTMLSSVAGLDYAYYSGTWTALPNFSSLIAVKSGVTHNADLSIRNADTNYGFTWNGNIDITTAGTYTFYAGSDDGSEISIDGNTVVNNDGIHPYQEMSGSVNLSAGIHTIGIEFFQATTAGQELTISYQGPGIAKEVIPDSVLTCTAPTAVDVAAFGAVGNGVTNDSTAIQNAINATPDGGTLDFDAGKTYLLGAGLNISRPINIEGNGATLLLDTSNSSANNTIFASSPLASTSYTWTGTAGFGVDSFNVAISPNVLLPGDTVFLSLGTDPNDHTQPNYGAVGQVISNTGSVVTLNIGLPTAYANYESALAQGVIPNSIQRITDVIQNVSFKDINFNYVSSTEPDTQIWLTDARNVTMNNLTGVATILANVVDSENCTVSNCNVTLVEDGSSSSGRLVTGWQDDNLQILNNVTSDAYDSANVFLESWARNTIITNLTASYTFSGRSSHDVFHFTGNSYGTIVNGVLINCTSGIDLVLSGAQSAFYQFGTVTVNGPIQFAPLVDIADLINGSTNLNQADTVTSTGSLTIGSNLSDFQVPLCNGVIETMTFTLTSWTGETTIFITNSNGNGANLTTSNLPAGVATAFPQLFGTDYPFDSPSYPAKTMSFYTSTVPANTTLTWSVTYYGTAPTVQTPPSATPISGQASSFDLSVLGNDPAGESSLTYTWSAVSGPAGVAAPTFSINGTNAAKNTIATFSQVGTYELQVTITDPSNLSTTATLNLAVTLATVSAASATPNPVAGSTTSLSILGNDAAGESTLTYTWACVSVPANAPPPFFTANGTNAAKNTTATFNQAGTYTFTATIKDQSGLSTTSTVNVVVGQTVTQMYVQPPKSSIAIGTTPLQYYVIGGDQFSNTINFNNPGAPTVAWSVSGGGTISSTGLFTPSSDGTFTVTAISDGYTAVTTVTVTGTAAPIIITTPIAPVAPVAPIVSPPISGITSAPVAGKHAHHRKPVVHKVKRV
jgi:hypothetical protein